MGDRRHHEPDSPTAEHDPRIELPPDAPPSEEQQAPGLKRHGDPLEAAIETEWRPGENPGEPEDDPTAQPDGDDGNPESGARGARELRETRRRSD